MKFSAGGFCVKWAAQQRLAGPHATGFVPFDPALSRRLSL
jgi:hypothetical protein